MNIEKIHKQFLSSYLLLFSTLFIFISVRLYLVDSQWNNLSFWACLVIQIGIAFFLLHLNHYFNIIQGHTLLPAFFYLLFVGINPAFYLDINGSIASLCIILSYYFLFESFQKPESQINALNISLLLVLGSLLWTPILFFFPVFWLGFHRFQCLNTRVFFANLIGFVIVYLFIFTFSVFKNDINIFFSFLPQFNELFLFQNPELSFFDWLTVGFFLIILCVIGIYLFLINISERLWTIYILSFFYISAFIILIFFFLQTDYKSSWSLVSYIPLSILFGHFFSHSNKRIVQYLLFFFIIFFIGIGFAQHISS